MDLRIVEDSPQRLVLRNRAIISPGIGFLAVAVCGGLVLLTPGSARGMNLAFATMLLGMALANAPRTQIVFDTAARSCTILRRTLRGEQVTEIPFGDIADIRIDMRFLGLGRRTVVYRLSLMTAKGATPLVDAFEPGPTRYEAMREKLVGRVFEGRTAPAAPRDPVGSLMALGRIDEAAALLRARDGVSLAAARADILSRASGR